MTIHDLLGRFERPAKTGDQWLVKCPGHEDRKASLAVREGDDGRLLLHCHAGCSAESIVAALGLKLADLFPLKERRVVSPGRITIADIAAAKGLPADLFYAMGWREEGGKIVIPYRDEAGLETPRPHVRTALRAKDGSHWGGPRDLPINTPYGTWRLEEFRRSNKLAICEGETDTLTMWHVGKPALGVPGASMVNTTLRPEMLRGFAHVLVFRDNDANGAGEKFSTAAADCAISADVGKVQIIVPPAGCKDVNDWYRRNPQTFVDDLRSAVAATPDYQRSGATTSLSCGTARTIRGADWPEPLHQAAFHGVLGEIVRQLEPHTEADPAAILVQLLAMFGNVIGRTAHFKAEADTHFLNLFTAVVGESSKGRKGVSTGRARQLFEPCDPVWTSTCQKSGLSSGEGLIWAVRDPIEKQVPVKVHGRPTGEYDTVIEDHGVADKRLLVIETELASTLRVLAREGNTLSALLRQAWDGLDLRVLTRNSPAKSTGPHISLIANITVEEVRRYLDATEAANGFGNRFLWVCARRSKHLPDGGGMPALGALRGRLQESVAAARDVREMRRDRDASARWHRVYPSLSDGRPGMLGAMTGRAEAQVMRLACLYALSDRLSVVQVSHLEAALALWRYCFASARYIFGRSIGNPLADTIWRAGWSATDGLTRSDIWGLIGRHGAQRDLDAALAELESNHMARREAVQDTGGRAAERWRFLDGAYQDSEKGELSEKRGSEADDAGASFASFASFAGPRLSGDGAPRREGGEL